MCSVLFIPVDTAHNKRRATDSTSEASWPAGQKAEHLTKQSGNTSKLHLLSKDNNWF